MSPAFSSNVGPSLISTLAVPASTIFASVLGAVHGGSCCGVVPGTDRQSPACKPTPRHNTCNSPAGWAWGCHSSVDVADTKTPGATSIHVTPRSATQDGATPSRTTQECHGRGAQH